MTDTPSLPRTMRAAIFKGRGTFQVETVPRPDPGPGQVLVEVTRACICGSDVHRALHGQATPGVVLGHEFAGVIRAMGEGVTAWKPGDRVVGGGGAAPPGWRSPAGEPAGARPPNPLSPWDPRFSPRMNARRGVPGEVEQGGFAQFKLMWDWQPLPAPDAVSDLQAALVEPLSVGLHAVRESGLRVGDTVVVIGLGTIGLVTGLGAKLGGALRLVGFDPSPRRRAAALAMGFDEAQAPTPEGEAELRRVLALTAGRGADLVFECAGARGTLEQAFRMARARGRIVGVALNWHESVLNPVDWIGREVEFRAVYGHGEAGPGETGWRLAIALQAAGRLDLSPLVDAGSSFPLEAIQAAFEACVRPDGIVKPVLLPGS
jgi:(R,R)-butanediol dehydrogenase/meso-butanediol dehydrogenase/diacetyl reductase